MSGAAADSEPPTEARQHYGWTTIAKQIAGLYEEVVAQRESERAETRVLATPQAADRPPMPPLQH